MTKSLIGPRDKIAKAWYSRMLPLDKFRVVDGNLTYDDLGPSYGVGNGRQYPVNWATLEHTEYVVATITVTGGDEPTDDPVIVYLRRGETGLEVVGIERRGPPVIAVYCAE